MNPLFAMAVLLFALASRVSGGQDKRDNQFIDLRAWVLAVEYELKLLSHPDVQKDLKLTSEQLAKVTGLSARYRDER